MRAIVRLPSPALSRCALTFLVHTAASAPRTRRKLDALGFRTSAIDTSEFEKAEAALTCLCLLFE